MKQAQITAAWDSILPDAAAENRMRGAVLSYQKAYSRKAAASKRMKLLAVPAAACLALFAVLGYRFRLTRPLHMTLENGTEIVYRAPDVSFVNAKCVWPEHSGTRMLTADELHTLLPCSAQPDPCEAVFRTDTGEFIHTETRIGDVHVHLSKNGFPVTDVIVTGTQTYTDICGVPVTFGYFLTKPNSRGIRTAVLYVSYARSDLNYYLEIGGDEARTEELGTALGNLVYEMLEADAPDLSGIQY